MLQKDTTALPTHKSAMTIPVLKHCIHIVIRVISLVYKKAVMLKNIVDKNLPGRPLCTPFRAKSLLVITRVVWAQIETDFTDNASRHILWPITSEPLFRVLRNALHSQAQVLRTSRCYVDGKVPVYQSQVLLYGPIQPCVEIKWPANLWNVCFLTDRIISTLRAYSHQTKAGAKSKKIKEQAKRSRNMRQR